MNESERKDIEFALARSLKDLNEAHNQRLKEEEQERLRVRDALRKAEEAAERARDAKAREILMKNQDRFVVSLNRKRVDPRKGMTFRCPHCGKAAPEIGAKVANHLVWHFPSMWGGDFLGEPVGLSFPRTIPLLQSGKCGSCKKSYQLRLIPIPY